MGPPRIRILGLSMDPTATVQADKGAKNAGLFHALAERFTVVGSVCPEVSRRYLLAHRLACFHPIRRKWRPRANLHPRLFAARSRIAGEKLARRSDEYDLVVQLHTLMGPGLPPIQNRPYVLHTDNTYRLSERGWSWWAPMKGRRRDTWVAMEGAVYRGAAAVFPRSEWLRRSLIDDYGCDPDRVVRVGGGANLRLPTLAHRRWDRQRALFVGKDWERKGGPDLLKAWPQVRKALPAACLQVVGILRPPRRLPEGVQWLGIVQDRDRMRRLFAEATVFVMPSRFEPWGHVFYEAMGSGLPCIGATTCAMPEIVTPDVGVCVRPGDNDALSDVLIRYLSQPELARTHGTAGWRAVETGHTWAEVVDRMAPHLERAVGR